MCGQEGDRESSMKLRSLTVKTEMAMEKSTNTVGANAAVNELAAVDVSNPIPARRASFEVVRIQARRASECIFKSP